MGRGGSVFATYSKVMERAGYPRKEPGDFYLQEFASAAFCVDQRKWYRFCNESEEAMNWLIDLVEERAAGSFWRTPTTTTSPAPPTSQRAPTASSERAPPSPAPASALR